MNRVAPPDADGEAPAKKTGHSGLDFGSSALMLALALWMWARLRA
jgi:hypothetical protein